MTEAAAQTQPQPRSMRVIALRGFLISLTNPKTLLFYGAFFPQFLSPDAPFAPQNRHAGDGHGGTAR